MFWIREDNWESIQEHIEIPSHVNGIEPNPPPPPFGSWRASLDPDNLFQLQIIAWKLEKLGQTSCIIERSIVLSPICKCYKANRAVPTSPANSFTIDYIAVWDNVSLDNMQCGRNKREPGHPTFPVNYRVISSLGFSGYIHSPLNIFLSLFVYNSLKM